MYYVLCHQTLYLVSHHHPNGWKFPDSAGPETDYLGPWTAFSPTPYPQRQGKNDGPNKRWTNCRTDPPICGNCPVDAWYRWWSCPGWERQEDPAELVPEICPTYDKNTTWTRKERTRWQRLPSLEQNSPAYILERTAFFPNSQEKNLFKKRLRDNDEAPKARF